MMEKSGVFWKSVLMGKTNTLWFNSFRQVFIVLEQGLEGFCNQYLATKTMKTMRTIRGLWNFGVIPVMNH